jgi:predicted glycosyltransferase
MSNRPIYTAEFHTDAEWALLEIKAATPEKALKKARTVDPDTLDFAPYGERHPVNYITIRDEDCNDLAEWQSDDLRLQLAARALLDAAEKVIASWERGDLAAAVRELDNAIANVKGGAA